jgi:hypothetical protein
LYKEASYNSKVTTTNRSDGDPFEIYGAFYDGTQWWYDGTSNGSTGYRAGNNLKGFNTGGYTGAWGPEGKLAVLHEKELVLN